MNLQQLINTLLGAAPEVGKGVVRGVTADVVGAPVDTLNAVRQGLLMPAQAGNPAAREIVGLLGPVQQAGTSDYFAQQMGLPEGQGMAYEAGRMLSPSPADIVSAFRRAPSIQELITYHGTPHRFPATEANPLGEFDASKIGTGEGIQAYGRGLYLAESPKVAGEYRVKLSQSSPLLDGRITNNSAEMTVARDLQTFGGDVSKTKAFYAAKEAAARKNAQFYKPAADEAERFKSYIDMIPEIAGKSYGPNPGSLYTADLPDEMVDRMLDWDKPVHLQTPKVREALQSIIDETLGQGAFSKLIRSKPDFKDLQDNALESLTDAQISEALRQRGIPGIKYLDQGSRGQGKGTRNFVVFPGEEKKVKILKRD